MPKPDLLLLHPPSVFRFRELPLFFGPVSDVVPSSSIFEIWLMSFMLLSGYLIPLELFPPWARAIAYALPFRYSQGFPVELLIGMIPDDRIGHDLLVQWTYVLVSLGGALWFWRAGLRRFGAFGG